MNNESPINNNECLFIFHRLYFLYVLTMKLHSCESFHFFSFPSIIHSRSTSTEGTVSRESVQYFRPLLLDFFPPPESFNGF